MRIGLIGAGRVAATHVRAMRAVAGVEIAAVVDPRVDAAAMLAAELGVPAFVSMREAMAAVSLDAVDLMVPHHLHHPLAMQALEAGIHVFMDKPIATRLQDGRELCETAERHGRTLLVCHNLLFHPALRRATELVRDGILGAGRRADAWSTGWLDIPPWDFRLDAEALGGGAWVDGSPHLVYALEACLGPITRLRADASDGVTRLGAEDTAVGHARFESGMVATLAIGYSDPPRDLSAGWPGGWRLGFELFGDGGRILVEFLPQARVAWQRSRTPETVERFSDTAFDDGFTGVLDEFVKVVAGIGQPTASCWDSLRNLELVRTALEG